MKAQLRLGETAEDRERVEAEAESIRAAAEAIPKPEYRYYHGDPGERLPMTVSACIGERLTLVIECDLTGRRIAREDIIREIQFHTEMLNKAVAIGTRGGT